MAGVSVRSMEKVSQEWPPTLLASPPQEALWKAQRYLHGGTSKPGRCVGSVQDGHTRK